MNLHIHTGVKGRFILLPQKIEKNRIGDWKLFSFQATQGPGLLACRRLIFVSSSWPFTRHPPDQLSPMTRSSSWFRALTCTVYMSCHDHCRHCPFQISKTMTAQRKMLFFRTTRKNVFRIRTVIHCI